MCVSYWLILSNCTSCCPLIPNCTHFLFMSEINQPWENENSGGLRKTLPDQPGENDFCSQIVKPTLLLCERSTYALHACTVRNISAFSQKLHEETWWDVKQRDFLNHNGTHQFGLQLFPYTDVSATVLNGFFQSHSSKRWWEKVQWLVMINTSGDTERKNIWKFHVNSDLFPTVITLKSTCYF